MKQYLSLKEISLEIFDSTNNITKHSFQKISQNFHAHTIKSHSRDLISFFKSVLVG